MKTKLSILQKILVYILGTTVLLFTVVFIYISNSARNNSHEQALKLTDSYAKQYAQNVESWLNEDFAVTRTLAAAFMEYRNLPQEQWLTLFRNMYNHVILTTPYIDAYWDSWEIKSLDPKWDKEFGRYFYIVYYEKGQLKTKNEVRSLSGNSATYQEMLDNEKEAIMEPYVSVLQGGAVMSTLSSPIRYNGVHIALVASDIKLTRFQKLVNNIKPFPNSQAFLISYQGNFVAHHDTSFSNKNITDKMAQLNDKIGFLDKVQKGQAFNFTSNDNLGRKVYYSVAPINIGKTGTPWALGIQVPYSDIMKTSNRSYNIGLAIAILSIGILIIAIVTIAYNITKRIKVITQNLQDLAKGKVSKSNICTIESGDETTDMSVALSESIQGIFEKTEFAKRIGEGDLSADITLLSKDDMLGKSLLEMRNNLREAKEQEEARKEDEKQKKWITEGLAKFGSILRHNNDNLELLSDDIIKNLVWYLNASVGGIFMASEEDKNKTFDLVASFAYDRKRFLKKSFQFSEGLIGACAAERDIIMLTEVPQDYIEITSGLGDANPNFLFLIPLINEDKVLGVIEIASLRVFNNYEVEFVKELAKSIAATLHTVRVNALTNNLFRKSQEQAEIMAEQEEEMRQNMEELLATQEEAARKTSELENLVNALNTSLYVMEYDTEGMVISLNDGFAEILGARREDIIGTHHLENLILSEEEKKNYNTFWNELLQGQTKKRKTRLSVNDKEHILLETYTAIYNERGEVYKVLKIAADITEA